MNINSIYKTRTVGFVSTGLENDKIIKSFENNEKRKKSNI